MRALVAQRLLFLLRMQNIKAVLAVALGSVLLACGEDPETLVNSTKYVRSERAIPGRYIVVLEPGEGGRANAGPALAARHGVAVERAYRHALHGFATEMT